MSAHIDQLIDMVGVYLQADTGVEAEAAAQMDLLVDRAHKEFAAQAQKDNYSRSTSL